MGCHYEGKASSDLHSTDDSKVGLMLRQRPGLFQYRSSSGTENVPRICHRPRTPPPPGAQSWQALQEPDERIFAGLGGYIGGK